MTLTSGWLMSFSGIDGSGKTSLIRHIRDWMLTEHGLDSQYMWCKFGAHPASKFRTWRVMKQVTRQGIDKRNSFVLSSTLGRIYGYGLLAIHLAQLRLVIRQSILRGNILVCDRYIFDTVVDLQQNMDFQYEQAKNLLSPSWIPVPRMKFLLDLPPHVAIRRIHDIAGTEYLKERQRLYLELADDLGLTVVNANQPFDQVCVEVINLISQNLKSYDAESFDV